MSILLLDGQKPDLDFEKQLNTLAMRHRRQAAHGREDGGVAVLNPVFAGLSGVLGDIRIEKRASADAVSGRRVYTHGDREVNMDIPVHVSPMRLLAGVLFLSAVLPGRVIPDGASTQSNVTIAVQ